MTGKCLSEVLFGLIKITNRRKRNEKKSIIFGLCLLEVTCALSAKDKKSIPLYKDAKVPIEKRVDDLLSRMTLEEKIL